MSIDKSHLILYKNPKLYNGSRYVYYQDNRDYDNWLSLSSYQTYSKDIVFKSLEENITINAFIDNVDEYTYGSITLNKTKYYFFVDKTGSAPTHTIRQLYHTLSIGGLQSGLR